jgi:5-methylcytosine-specific restriction endonuclease McrA
MKKKQPTEAQLKYWKSLKGKKGHGFPVGHKTNVGRPGVKHNKKTRAILSKWAKENNWQPPSRKGIASWNKGTKGVMKRNKTSFTAERVRGDKNVNWRGGVSPLNVKIRGSKEYRIWRSAVLERDGYRCVWCGSNGSLHADHIKPFALFPELRFAIDNGRTLCIPCHKSTDTYGVSLLRRIKESANI